MAVSIWKQFQIGLWKWWILRKKQPLLFLSELLWPCLLVLALILLHPLARPGAHTPCYFHARANPSVGLVPYAQTMMCNINNLCNGREKHQDIPSFPGSRFNEIVEYSEPFFNSDDVNEAIKVLPDALKLIDASVMVLNNSFIKEILGKCLYLWYRHSNINYKYFEICRWRSPC